MDGLHKPGTNGPGLHIAGIGVDDPVPGLHKPGIVVPGVGRTGLMALAVLPALAGRGAFALIRDVRM